MGEPKPVRLLALQLEYRLDRLWHEKLAQVYQALVPDLRRPIAGALSKSVGQNTEMIHEQASGHLRSSVL